MLVYFILYERNGSSEDTILRYPGCGHFARHKAFSPTVSKTCLHVVQIHIIHNHVLNFFLMQISYSVKIFPT